MRGGELRTDFLRQRRVNESSASAASMNGAICMSVLRLRISAFFACTSSSSSRGGSMGAMAAMASTGALSSLSGLASSSSVSSRFWEEPTSLYRSSSRISHSLARLEMSGTEVPRSQLETAW